MKYKIVQEIQSKLAPRLNELDSEGYEPIHIITWDTVIRDHKEKLYTIIVKKIK